MTPHPSLTDWPDERRFSELVATHRSGFAAGTDVMPLDVSRFPPSAAFGDECACEGAAPVVSYDAGQVIRESERENWPLLIFGSVVAVALVLAACVVWPWGFA